MTNPSGVTSRRTLTDAECVDRLFAATVGRVAFVSPDGLQVIPVSVRATGTSLMLDTSSGSPLSQLVEMGRDVTSEVDETLTSSGQALTVPMHGSIVKLDAHGHRRREAMSQQAEAWVGSACSQPLEFTPRTHAGRLVQHPVADTTAPTDRLLDEPTGAS